MIHVMASIVAPSQRRRAGRRRRQPACPALHRPRALRRRRGRAGARARDLRRQRRPPARRPAAFVTGEAPAGRVRACYPFVRVHTDTVARADSRLSYGFVAGPGTYETTLTRPDLFARLLPRAVPPAAAEPRRRARGRHQRAADPGALLVRRARPHRGQPDAGAAPAAARPVRPARPRRDGRRHRQRHLRAARRRAAAAGAVHRAARRLLAASPAPLHRHGARALPELRAVHQLPVLHRRVRAPRPRGDGRRGDGELRPPSSSPAT